MKKIFLMLSLSLILSTASASGLDMDISRVGGANRYDTAVEASKKAFTKAPAVVIASGESFPDALAGSSLASSLGGPILLTGKSSINHRTLEEIVRLEPRRIVILGSYGSVSQEVENKLRPLARVERIGGEDRYETAALIAKEVVNINGKTEVGLASGQSFPDALASSSYLKNKKIPLLLTDPGKLPDATRKFMATMPIDAVTVFGGENAVSSAALMGLPGVKRLAGSNRIGTALAIARAAYDKPVGLVLANGHNFPDALSATSLVKKLNGPTVLVDANNLDKDVETYILDNKVEKITIVGGMSSVSNDLINKLWTLGQEEIVEDKPDLKKDSFNTAYAKDLGDLINKTRKEMGKSTLKANARLDQAARTRAKELSQTFPEVKRPDGSDWSTVDSAAKGQFIVAINGFPQDVLEYLKHLADIGIERKDLVAMGIGTYTDMEGDTFWVVIYGLDEK